MAKFLKDLDRSPKWWQLNTIVIVCADLGNSWFSFSSISFGHSKTFLSDKDINLLLTFPFYVTSFCLGNPTSNFCGWLSYNTTHKCYCKSKCWERARHGSNQNQYIWFNELSCERTKMKSEIRPQTWQEI